LNSVKEAEGILYAVAPHYQRRGVSPALMVHSLHGVGLRVSNRC
jgi:hypothetical protein